MKYTVLKRENKNSGWKSKNYYVRYYENGQLKYIDTNKTSKSEANIIAKDLISNIPEPIKVNESSKRNLTLKQYLTKFNWFSKTELPPYKEYTTGLSKHIFQEGAALRTTFNLNRLFNTFNDEIGSCIYYNISMDETNKFKERLLNYDLTATAKNSIIEALRTVYSYLMRKDKYITFNPFCEIKVEFFPTKFKKKYVFAPYEIYYLFNKDLLQKIEPKYFSREQWDRFLNSDFFLAFKFAAYTGMRTNEITALIPSQIKDDRIVTINRAFKDKTGKVVRLPKNNQSRTIILCDEAYKCIAEKLEIRKNNEFIFQTKFHTHLYNRYTNNWTNFRKEILNAFDIEIGNLKFTPHGLRKSLNTNLLRYSSLKLKESLIRAYCGWSDAPNSLTPVQEKHYTTYSNTDLNTVAREIQRIYVKDSKKILNNFYKTEENSITFSSGWTPTEDDSSKYMFLEKVYNIIGKEIEEDIKEIKLTEPENQEIERNAMRKLETIRRKENELNFIRLLIKVKAYINNNKALNDKVSKTEKDLLKTIVNLLNRENITDINKIVYLDSEIQNILENIIVKQLIDYYNDISELANNINSGI